MQSSEWHRSQEDHKQDQKGTFIWKRFPALQGHIARIKVYVAFDFSPNRKFDLSTNGGEFEDLFCQLAYHLEQFRRTLKKRRGEEPYRNFTVDELAVDIVMPSDSANVLPSDGHSLRKLTPDHPQYNAAKQRLKIFLLTVFLRFGKFTGEQIDHGMSAVSRTNLMLQGQHFLETVQLAGYESGHRITVATLKEPRQRFGWIKAA
ncbi:hypothetical protein BDV96DRAFT_565355 [Lophiotrema nucula]|uniref:Uncharacterized protein n=1 Tax=Lophiotrema nucula TaxID=690887 RepID=A0A6A5ZP84_9PLEO|nr:hypothetical protein BDV96DRAFT_565355 [Lophiotrema nucula]